MGRAFGVPADLKSFFGANLAGVFSRKTDEYRSVAGESVVNTRQFRYE